MADNQEIIEASLCAYIEGELDAAGRAEIEKHLEANPQHRQLLEDLTRTRDMLRLLPRESAPSEIAETINGQLERAALLNPTGEEDSELALRPNRWPQLMAMAAIIVLGIGLAAVVYFSLPSQQRPMFGITAGPKIGESPASSDGAPSPDRPAASLSPDAALTRGKPAGPGARRMLSKSGDVAGKGGAEPIFLVVNTMDPGSANEQVAQFLVRNRIPYEEAETEPAVLQKGIGGNDRLQQEAMPSAPNVASGPRDDSSRFSKGPDAVAGNKKDASDERAGGTEADAPPPTAAGKVAVSSQPPEAGAPRNEIYKSIGGAQASEEQMRKSQEDQAAIAHGEAKRDDSDKDVQLDAKPSHAAQAKPDAPQMQLAEAQQRQQLDQTSQQKMAQNSQTYAANGSANYRNNYIIARRMTRRQAEELSSSLSQPKAAQQAAVYDQYAAGNFYNAKQSEFPANAALGMEQNQAGQSLKYQDRVPPAIRPSQGPAAMAAPRGASSPDDDQPPMAMGEKPKVGTQPSTTQSIDLNTEGSGAADLVRSGDVLQLNVSGVQTPDTAGPLSARVAEDGTIRLPGIEPVASAGHTVREVQEAVAGEYRRAKLGDSPAVTISRARKETVSQAAAPSMFNRAPGSKSEDAGTATAGANGTSNRDGAAGAEVSAEDKGNADHQETTPLTSAAPSAPIPAGDNPGTQPATAPSTQPALADQKQQIERQPAQQGGAAEDEPVDVVIVVQNVPPISDASGAAAPATQPSNAPAAALEPAPNSAGPEVSATTEPAASQPGSREALQQAAPTDAPAPTEVPAAK